MEWYENCMELEKIDRGQLNILSFNTWALPMELAGHDHKDVFNYGR
ncbi:MAG: hypothetical protein IPO92_03745 [Saprospiraceae bacterium]|nr:hypothetical protein [Saprospiraceae bacterium]